MEYIDRIDVHNNYIYFTQQGGRLCKQTKPPGSSKIQLHSDTPYMRDVKVYKITGRYNVIELYIS
jgi:hypothetical protein